MLLDADADDDGDDGQTTRAMTMMVIRSRWPSGGPAGFTEPSRVRQPPCPSDGSAAVVKPDVDTFQTPTATVS
jgi:hypothetical protein